MNTLNLDYPPFKIQFKNLEEIRMGSPYNGCDLELVGSNNHIRLPKATWQDKYAWSFDFKVLVLIEWQLEEHFTGFRFFIIDTDY